MFTTCFFYHSSISTGSDDDAPDAHGGHLSAGHAPPLRHLLPAGARHPAHLAMLLRQGRAGVREGGHIQVGAKKITLIPANRF